MMDGYGTPCAQDKMITSLEDCKKCMGEGTDPTSLVPNLRSLWTDGRDMSYMDGGQSISDAQGGCHYSSGQVYLNTHPNPTGGDTTWYENLCKSGEATPSPTPDASSGASIKIGSGSIKLGSGSIRFGNEL